MTKNEVNIVKNSVLDSTEAYVEARLSVLDFVRTQIGVVQGEPVKGTDRKYRHVVKCNATSNTSGITYNNVLSVGNIPFPKNSVVFLIAPNAQFSNQFILGKLDDTPCNISAGSITLGDAIYLSSTVDEDGSYGHIASFNIYPTKFENRQKVTISGVSFDQISILQPNQIRVATFFQSQYKMSLALDGQGGNIALMTGIRGTQASTDNGAIIASNADGWGDTLPSPFSGDYVGIKPQAIVYNINGNDGTIGEGALHFLMNNQDTIRGIRIDANDDRIRFRYEGHSATLNWS